MNTKKFSEAISEVGENYYEEAARYERRWKKHGWIKWASIAACLCLIVGGVFLYHQNIGDDSNGNNNIAMLFTEAKVIEVYSPRSVLVEIVEENIYNANTEENLFLVGDIVQADFNEEIVLQFTAGDIVIIGRGNTAKVDYSQKPYIAQCNSIRIKAEED